uniref:cDNA FLJ52987, highly similar to Fibronectin type 3 and ankyrin repeat domains protein 1 n=1 Tax=Homo sapiens TaxID=9606 RepID=B7Z939_HUMAN|nr:unnamed protein product [Homo sapiens]
MPPSKPHPPVVGKVTHHSIELYWDLEKKAKRQGPQEQWFRFSIEEEDPKMHTYGIIYTGYATKHVVEGLEPRTLYRFRLKVTSPSGECEYSPLVSVSTTSEYSDRPHSPLSRSMEMTSNLEKIFCLSFGLTRSRNDTIFKHCNNIC